MLEVGLALPFLLALLAGSVQVGTIAYGMVSVDTAAREAGMVGQTAPKTSLDPVVTAVGTRVYTCKSSDRTVETNPICIAAFASAGLLDKTKMTVTIQVRGSSLLSVYQPPPDVVRTDAGGNDNGNGNTNTCAGNLAQVSGAVSGLPSGQEAAVISSTDGAQTTTSGQSYTLCTSSGSGTVSASVTVGSCVYSGATSTQTFGNNKTYTAVNIAVSASCTTTTSTSGGGSTSTGTSSTGSTVNQSTSSVSTFSCSQSVTYPGYFTVSVSYPVGIFVPVIGNVFADSGKSYRTVTSTVDEEIAPCGVTNGS
jgi:hypothetical protein